MFLLIIQFLELYEKLIKHHTAAARYFPRMNLLMRKSTTQNLSMSAGESVVDAVN